MRASRDFSNARQARARAHHAFTPCPTPGSVRCRGSRLLALVSARTDWRLGWSRHGRSAERERARLKELLVPLSQPSFEQRGVVEVERAGSSMAGRVLRSPQPPAAGRSESSGAIVPDTMLEPSLIATYHARASGGRHRAARSPSRTTVRTAHGEYEASWTHGARHLQCRRRGNRCLSRRGRSGLRAVVWPSRCS
jgi:hypothetical protein